MKDRKKNESKPFIVRLPKKLHKSIKLAAVKREVSMNTLINNIISEVKL